MAVKAGTAYVDIEGDFSGLNKQVSRHFSKMGKQAGGTGKKIGRTLGVGMAAGVAATVVAGKQLFDFGKDAVEVASNVNEALNKNEALFGKYAKGIEKFSKRSGDALGISRKEALVAAGTFGGLFEALKIGDRPAAQMSTRLVKLASDLASFGDATPQEALEALRSGLSGEAEPMRKFNAFLSEGRVKAEAYAKGLAKPGAELTEQQKIQARYSLILKDTAKAHGDFAKTSDDLANRQRRLKARWTDMKTMLGEALLPAVNNVSGALLNIADDVQPKVQRAIKNITRIFGRDDLSFGEKIQRSWDAVRLEFGPMANRLLESFRSANVDDKLKDAFVAATPVIAEGVAHIGLKSADAFLKAFLAAPTWAKFVTGGILLKKLGLTGPMLKLLTGRVGGAGGLGGAVSSLKPVPVFVENWKLLAGGGALAGAPAAVGGASWKNKIPKTDPAAGSGGFLTSAMKATGATAGGVAAGAAATSFTSKFKGKIVGGMKSIGPVAGVAFAGAMGSALLGEVVGGKTGKKISSIGGSAALWGGLGATAGSFIAPGIGTGIGAAVGAIGGGVYALLKKEKPDLVKAGAELMKTMLPPDIFERTVSEAMAGRVGKLEEDIKKRTDAIADRSRPQMAGGGRFAVPESKERALKELALNDADKAQIAKNYNELGKIAADAYIAGLEVSREFFGAAKLTARFTESLNKMKPAARQAALDSMITFARTMEEQGRLPKGASARIVANIKQTFGLLPSGITSAAKKGMDSLANQLRRRDAVNAAEAQRQALAQKWDDLPRMAKFSGKTAVNNFKTEIDFLKDKVKNSNGRMKRQAEVDLKAVQEQYRKYGRLSVSGFDGQLRELNIKGSARMKSLREKIVTDAARMARGVKGAGGDMEKHLDTALRNMGIKGDKKSRNVRDKVKRAIAQMATGVGSSSGSAATSLYDALNNMGVNADNILKSLGIKKPKYVLNRPPNAPGANGELRPTQRGSYISGGKPSGDSIPILAERGEYVLNREAVKKIGKHNLDTLNFQNFPRFQQGGGIVELLHPFNDPAGHGGSNSHLHIAASTLARIIQIGKWLQSRGWLVGENPAFGGIQGNHDPGGWHPKGLAIDVNWPDAGAEGAKIRAILPLLGSAAGLPAAIEKLGKYTIEGPAGSLLSTAQGFTDRVRSAFNNYIESKASFEGAEPGRAGTLSKAQLRSLWVRAGGPPEVANTMAAIALAESGGDPNIQGPTTQYGFRAAGLWQIHPPQGNDFDPLTNAGYAVGKYRSSGFQPWEAYTNGSYRNFLQQGGPVSGLFSLFKKGGDPKKDKKPKIKPPKWVEGLKHFKKHAPNKHLTFKALAALGRTGHYGDTIRKRLQRYSDDVDMYADWAQRANDITNTDELQNALNLKMGELVVAARARGETVDFSETGLLKLFPVVPTPGLPDQSTFIDTWLRGNANVKGDIQKHWLGQELNSLFGWRNLLIDNITPESRIRKALERAREAYKKVKQELRRIDSDIAKYAALRKKAIDKRNKHRNKIEDLRDQRDKEERQKKPGWRKRVADINKKIPPHVKEREEAEDDIKVYDRKLDILRDARKRTRKRARTLGGDNGNAGDTGQGASGRIFKIKDAIDNMKPNLESVHGLGTTHEKFSGWDAAANTPPLGLLGGTILNVQNEILGITANAPRATAEDTSADTSAATEEINAILMQQLKDERLRTAVSQAQFDVFRDLPTTFGNYPFGGFFAEGGPVPGPVGAPRMIVAHGGEYVVPNDGAGMGTHVSLHFASGMEWLKQFVDVRVENQTRTQGRRGERGLPGRAGLLTR